jgi:hypothetical protein
LGAPEVAQQNDHQIVETEHLMLVLLQQQDGLTARVFIKVRTRANLPRFRSARSSARTVSGHLAPACWEPILRYGYFTAVHVTIIARRVVVRRPPRGGHMLDSRCDIARGPSRGVLCVRGAAVLRVGGGAGGVGHTQSTGLHGAVPQAAAQGVRRQCAGELNHTSSLSLSLSLSPLSQLRARSLDTHSTPRHAYACKSSCCNAIERRRSGPHL